MHPFVVTVNGPYTSAAVPSPPFAPAKVIAPMLAGRYDDCAKNA
jgi:hypothetical protein